MLIHDMPINTKIQNAYSLAGSYTILSNISLINLLLQLIILDYILIVKPTISIFVLVVQILISVINAIISITIKSALTKNYNILFQLLFYK